MQNNQKNIGKSKKAWDPPQKKITMKELKTVVFRNKQISLPENSTVKMGR